DGAGLNNQPTTNSGSSPAPKDLAYVIYTSGSTGKPKGVMIEHRSLVDYVFGLNEKTKIDQCRSFALVSTIATDLGNTVIFSSLVFGGALHLFSKETVSNAAALHHYFKVNQIDCLKIVPSHWKALSEDEKLLLPNKLLVFGGEALQADMVEDIRLSGSNCQVVNHYGPTETTIGKLLHVVNDNNKYSGAVPIGKPFSNTTIYILSKELQPCPIGVLGQLYIAGDGVASRYLNNEELTKEKFIANPFGKDGPVMYATGDLVKYLPNGDVLFAGRVDDQVKIRGYRVELGEIESVLQQSALVKQAVVLAREDKQGNKRLVAYIVAEDEFDRDEILSYLKEKLPEYMIPALLMELESLPLTANGKVDRKALPDPDASELLSDKYVAPRNEAEEKLAAIWQDVLEVEQVGIHDDFFELGGHSLLAVRLISAIRKAFNVEMPIGDIFDYPTVATLTGQVGKQAGKAVLPAIEIADPRPGKIPLSFSQERLWFIDQLEGSVQYHVPSVLRLKGKLNLDALAATLQEIVNRHEVLRTVFVEEAGVPYQQVKNKDHWKLTVTDGSRYKKDSNGLQQEIQQIIIDPFILSRDYMMRAHVIVLAEGDQVLVFTVHHIASDGWSRSILVKEVVALYKAYDEGFDAALPPLKIQYADFAIWQRNYLQGELLEKKLTYWKEKLEEVAPLQLATDHPRPPVQSSKGAMIGFNIEKPLADRLQDLGKQHGTTIFMTLLAAFKILLHRYSGQEDICVGTPVAGRQQQETEELIGFFVNTLALRSEVNANDAFIKFLEQIKVTTMEAYQHQDIPFEKVVEEVSKVRDLNRSPVFQVMFVLRNTPDVPELPLGETMLTREQYKHTTAQFDLTLFVTETTRGLQCAVEYSTDLFVEATIGKMVTHFSVLLGSIVNHPGQKIGALKMLTDVEEQQLLVEFNNTKVDFPKEKTIVSLFEEQVKRTPATIAAVFENERITYHQLNERANKLAHYLQARGITPGTLVPLCVERSFDMIIGVLAILKAGAAYVPIDPYFPAERVSYILKDTNADLIIGSKKSRPLLPFSDSITVLEIDGADVASISDLQGTNFKVAVAPDHIAYVLYTSGSTGKPKGVKMGGAGLVNLLSWQEKQFTNKHRRVLQFASLNFDVSFQEIFSTLCFGSCLYLVDADRRRDMSELAKDIATQELTHLFIPYIVLKNLVEFIYPIGNHKFSLEEIIVAGEQLKLSEDIRDLMKQTGVKVINQYGPTEAHVVSSYRIDSAYTVSSLPPIGKPIDNMKLYILGDGGEPVPVGVLGELYIGGVQVAQGYLNLPELTRERFLTNRFSNDADCRLYKTGDLARWLPDGNIEYLGRKDDQEKIRGYRVELGEIETVLQQSGWIKQGVVVAKEDSAGNKRLVAYVVPGEDYDKREVFVYLKKKLPEYMIPVLIVEMRSLPLTRNGKVDKKALPDMHANHLVQKEYVAPENDLQKILAEIWQKLLRVERVGIYDNFFELGGHSLLAVKLVSSIRKTLQMDFPLNYIFIYPTIFAIANNLVEKNKHPLRPKVNIKYLVPLKTGGNKIPLYIICGGGGTARRFIKFANMMEEEQPVYALQPIVDSKGVNNMGSIEELASQFIEEIMINNPDGPYALSGHCLGGITAFEMAKQLEAKGKKVHMLAMFDTIIRKRERVERANFNNLYNIPGAVKKVMSKAALKIDFETYLLTRHTRKAIGYKMRSFSALIKKWRRRQDTVNDLEYAGLEIFNESSNEYIEARKNYKITPYNGEILVFYAKERYYFTDVTQNIRFKKFFINDSTKNLWREYASSVSIFEIEGDHSDIFETVHGNKFAMLLQQQLNRPVKR
ncbi:MAG: amino acid adenylation domain-containing protein, partial [Ferruginibacter sp.]